MTLLEALVMVADTYPEKRGWIIQGSDMRIAMVIGPLGPSYSASDQLNHVLLRANRRLEVVIAELLARHPEATKYEHWKISPYEEL